MKISLSIKTLLRTPFKTLLTFLLLTAITFALFTRVAEYTIIEREIQEVAKKYIGVGAIEASPAAESYPDDSNYIYTDSRVTDENSFFFGPQWKEWYDTLKYKTLSEEQITKSQSLKYVLSSDKRYMTAGVSEKYHRLDEGGDFYNYTNRFVIEGTIVDIEYDVTLGNGKFNRIIVKDIVQLTSNPYDIPISGLYKIYTVPVITELGGLNSSRASWYYDEFLESDTAFLEKLTIGDKYVFIGRVETSSKPEFHYIGDAFVNYWTTEIQAISHLDKDYLNTANFESLNTLIEFTESDIHTFDMVYTSNMASIMRFARGDMVMAEGRLLDENDTKNSSKVCVVSQDFASANDIKIGDKIDIKLGTELFEQYKGLGAVAGHIQRFKPATITVEIEVVGIYIDTDTMSEQASKPHWSYSINTIFVPRSLLAINENELTNHEFTPSEYSFVVSNAWDIHLFIDEMASKKSEFQAMGITIEFSDNGWMAVRESYVESKRLSQLSLSALLGATIAATGLIVYLYIGRKKKDFAIMRALGEVKSRAIRSLIIPLMVLTLLAVILGTVSAFIYSNIKIVDNIMTDHSISSEIPFITFIITIIGQSLLVLLFTFIEIRKISNIPPLLLLQGDKVKKIKTTGKSNQDNDHHLYKDQTFDFEIPNSSKDYRNRNRLINYVLKHMKRSMVKSLLLIVLSGLLLGVVGQVAKVKESYIDVCNETKVESNFINGLSIASVKVLIDSEFQNGIYYEFSDNIELSNRSAELIVTNDIIRYTGQEPNITYGEGYDASNILEPNNYCVVSKDFLINNNLSYGDRLVMTPSYTYQITQSRWLADYRIKNSTDIRLDDDLLFLYEDEIKKEANAWGKTLILIGSIEFESGEYKNSVFSRGFSDSNKAIGHEMPLTLVEVIVKDNFKFNDYRVLANYLVEKDNEIMGGDITFVMDTSKVDSVLDTINMIEKLFPAAFVASIVIGSILIGLIIIQSSKEAAILRLLGTTRLETKIILVIEPLLLCIVGCGVGILALLIINGQFSSDLISVLKLYSVFYLIFCFVTAMISSILVSHRHILNQLQTKE